MFSEENTDNRELTTEENTEIEEVTTEDNQAPENETEQPTVDHGETAVVEQNEPSGESRQPKQKKTKNKKTYTRGQLVFVTCIAVFVSIVITTQVLFIALTGSIKKSTYEDGKNAEFFKLLNELQGIYEANYLYADSMEITTDEMLMQYVALSGDRYARYYTREEWAAEQQSMIGQSAGIGCYVSLDIQNNCIYVIHVFKGSPAYEAGLRDKDVVIAVDGNLFEDIGVEAGYTMVPGKKGTSVTLTVMRNGKRFDFKITRGDYTFEPVMIDVLEIENHKIGYVHIIEFIDTTPEYFDIAVSKLKSEYCEGIIIDLRNNPGGQLNAIVSLLDYIEPKGEIVQIYKKDGTMLQSYKSDSRELDMPLAVLCNENTASAAELMTRSLMDTGKAESYGVKTFGKGCGQSGYQLSNGSVVYVTSFYYKTPESDNYDGIGITPDHVVDYPEGVNSINLFVQDHEDDVQLQAALTGLYKSIIGD